MLKNIIKKFYSFNIYSNKKSLHYEDGEIDKYFIDNAIYEYPKTIKTFLQKRYINKEEIWPKLYKLDRHDEISENSWDNQKLYYLKKLKNSKELQKELNKGNINTSYLFSLIFEPFYKEMIDEFLKINYINGHIIPMKHYKEYLEIREKCITEYKRFFFGDESSDLEIYIENIYLKNKLDKYENFLESKNSKFECLFTKENYNRMLYIINSKNRDPLYYDDFKPIFKSIIYNKLWEYDILVKKLDEKNISYKFSKFINSLNWKKSYKYINELSILIHNRIHILLDSLEFVNILNLPPDFHIKNALYNFHVWMIYQRLIEINNPFSLTLAKQLLNELNSVFKDKTKNIYIKKKEDFIKDLLYYMDINRKFFEKHFIYNIKTSRNPYIQIDALVWSTIFFEKVDRYDDCIYLMSEYIIKNWEIIRNVSLENIENLEFDFDVFLVPIDYKQKIIEINPPLSKEKMEAEKENKKKSYQYNGDMDFGFDLPLDLEINNINNKRIEKLKNKFEYIKKKYDTLSTYDYFNDQEEKEDNKKKLSEKYIWNYNENNSDFNIYEKDKNLLKLREKIKN